MNRNLCLLAILLLPLISFTQTEPSKFSYTFTGYVRAEALFDTRQIVEAREGYLLFYPKRQVFDAEGNDINDQPSFNQYAMTTRLGVKVKGVDILGAKSMALVEGDFTGASNSENNSLRLRHAYITLQWKTSRLLVGQYWHPMDVPEMIPSVLALNTGAPFHSFSRQPQIRFDQKLGDFNLVAVAASQRDYVNRGPAGNSTEYLRNSAIPNFHGQLQYKPGKLLIGAGVDYKRLKPRLITDKGFKSNESLDCISWTGFLKTEFSGFTLKAQYVLNNALNDHLMMGGFGVTGIDTLTDRRDYTTLPYHSVWCNLSYTKGRWQPSIFAGYTGKTNDDTKFAGDIYARDADVNYVYRISPSLTFIQNNFSFVAEFEYTVAEWNEEGSPLTLVKNRNIGVLRTNLAVIYSF